MSARPRDGLLGPDGVKRATAQIRSVFPDRRVEVQALVAEGNRVAAEWTLCGTQKRERLGVPPIGRRECISALSLFRVEDGKIVEHWMTEGIPALNYFQPDASRRLTVVHRNESREEPEPMTTMTLEPRTAAATSAPQTPDSSHR